MDRFDWLIFIIAIGLMTVSFLIGTRHPFEKVVVTQYDTIVLFEADYNLIKQNDSLLYEIDSLQTLNLKYKEELELANFKLERIRYYNNIAANNNNIKYLRGWINRVFNE